MTREEIIQAVQVRLDELSPFDDIEEVPAINYIDKLLNASTDTVFRLLPYYRLPLKYLNIKESESENPEDTNPTDPAKSETTTTYELKEGVLPGEWYMQMPLNYIKFGEASLDGWRRTVKEIADYNTELLQGSKYTMGTPSKPVVVQRRSGDSRYLHFFSSPAKPTDAKIFVVVSVLPEDCPDDLVDAIAWQCASDVLISLSKTNDAKVAQEKVLTHGV